MNFATNKRLLKKNTRRERRRPAASRSGSSSGNRNKELEKNTHNKPIITNNAGEVRDADLATEFPAKDEPQSEREKRKLQLAEKRSLRQMAGQVTMLCVSKVVSRQQDQTKVVNIGIENLSRKIHDLDILIETLSKHGKSLRPTKTLVNLMCQFCFFWCQV